MGRKHCGKGEIARCEQFLLFPLCFQKACFLGVSKGVIVWEWVKRAFEKVVGKGENAGNQLFLTPLETKSFVGQLTCFLQMFLICHSLKHCCVVKS